MGFGLGVWSLELGLRFPDWIWSDHVNTKLFCNPVHCCAGRILLVVSTSHRETRFNWKVDNIISRRIVYRAGRMLVYACSKMQRMRCRWGSSMGHGMLGSGVLGCRDLHDVSFVPRWSLAYYGFPLCGFCESSLRLLVLTRYCTTRY